jgi:hypothetical protein
VRDDRGQTDTRLGDLYRRDSAPPRQAESHRRGLPGHLQDRLDRHQRPRRWFTDPGAGYHHPYSPQRQTRAKIAEIEWLNPGTKVTLIPIGPAPVAA